MTQIKLRRDTAANFTSKNPVLGIGEPAYETDTKKLKIGDGTTAYNSLPYFSAGGGGGSEPPSNMMTTDTTQMTLSGTKYWVSGAQLGIGSGLILDENFVNVAGGKLDITKQTVDGYADIPVIHTSNPYIVLSARQKIKFQYDGSAGYYDILDSSHLGEYVDGTTITYTNNKLTAVGGGGSAPANMVTTDTAQDITGAKSFTTGKITFKDTDPNRKILGEINGNGFYCNYYTDKASGEKPCYLGKVARDVFNMGIPDLTGVTGRIYANTLTKWNGVEEVGTILDSSNLGSYVDGTTITYTNNKLTATGSAGMPSNRYIDLTLGASGTEYTAPANGWFSVYGNFGNVNGYFSLISWNNATGSISLILESKANGGSYSCSCCIPVKKGDKISANYNYSPFSSTASGTPFFKFIYAEGSKE